MAIKTDFSDMKRLEKTIKKMGTLPQKCVTKAARKGGNVVMREVKATAPVDTGDLKSGIRLKPEKSRVKGKKVYQITFASEMNDIFQKKNADGKITGYYPVSMEYGYFSKSGRYIPGYRFMRNSAESKAAEVSGVTIKTLADEVDKEWSKK